VLAMCMLAATLTRTLHKSGQAGSGPLCSYLSPWGMAGMLGRAGMSIRPYSGANGDGCRAGHAAGVRGSAGLRRPRDGRAGQARRKRAGHGGAAAQHPGQHHRHSAAAAVGLEGRMQVMPRYNMSMCCAAQCLTIRKSAENLRSLLWSLALYSIMFTQAATRRSSPSNCTRVW
jgi:hypothetical protein